MKGKPAAHAVLLALRMAALALAVMAVADLRVPTLSRDRIAFLVFDASDSVGAEALERARTAGLSLLSRMRKDDRIGIIAFAAKPAVLLPPSPPREASTALASLPLTAGDGSGTDIGLALAAASSYASEAGGRVEAFLFSDGRETSSYGAGGVRTGIGRTASGRSPSVKVDVIPIGPPPAGIRSSGLSLPALARADETSSASWTVESDRAARISWTMEIDGAFAAAGKASLSPGANAIALSVPAGAPGAHEIRMTARDSEGRIAAEASAGGLLQVSGPAQALVVRSGDSPSPIVAALRAQGVDSRDVPVDSMPESAAGYASVQAVVLDDINALFMSESQQTQLVSFVAGGGGLLVVGGGQSLGRGEYYATPLEDVLPVETDTRRRLFFTRAKILFVIDNSGSMSERTGTMTKQMAAMRGVAASLSELDPQDEVGILSFDDRPSWILPFTRADNREAILASLSRVPEGGGTDLAAALTETIKGFSGSGPIRKHAIVLSDGNTLAGDFEGLSTALKSSGVTLTAIGIGEDVNEELLKGLAEKNDGSYYRANLDQIPKIMNKETVRVTRDLMQEGRFAVAEAEASGGAEGIAALAPPISGYLVTKAKALATVQLTAKALGPLPAAPAGAAAPAPDPLLASWRYGSGRVAVFASDSGSRWLKSWAGTAAYSRLWSQVLRSVEPGSADSGLEAVAVPEMGRLKVAVEAVGADRRSLTGLDLKAREIAAGSLPFALRETAPGRYEAFVPPLAGGAAPQAAGLRRFAVSDSGGGERAEAWIWSPGSAETARLGPDSPALASWADATGGAFLDPSDPRVSAPEPWLRLVRVRWYMVLAAVALLLVELYGRSTMFGQLAMAKATFSAWLKMQRGLADEIDGFTGIKPLQAKEEPTRDDSEKVMRAYRRLAERSLERERRRG